MLEKYFCSTLYNRSTDFHDQFRDVCGVHVNDTFHIDRDVVFHKINCLMFVFSTSGYNSQCKYCVKTFRRNIFNSHEMEHGCFDQLR